jgi:hypothetical protein
LAKRQWCATGADGKKKPPAGVLRICQFKDGVNSEVEVCAPPRPECGQQKSAPKSAFSISAGCHSGAALGARAFGAR